ncbi:MAG: adenine phosphoribosyltransferase [Candidatus Poribacteria bacterium]|nr:MAG: adenine phosphoribosyltransferase [Candidatus Poribacteria bacterium]
MLDFSQYIRNIPDFPEPGVQFKDITPLLQEPAAFRGVVDAFADHFSDRPFEVIAAVDARGFIFGGALAYRLGKSLIPIRKRGKLPYKTVEVEYELEYGRDAVAVHEDALRAGRRVLLVDDVIATGGTLAASAKLIEKLGGEVVGIAALIELNYLHGREKLQGYEIYSLIRYDQ